MNIGLKIKELRTKRGLSQPELAKRAGVSQQLISNLENGGSETTKKLPQIARALGAAPEEIDARYSRERQEFESAVDHDIGRAEAVDTIREIDVRAGAGGGGIPVEAWVSDGNGNTYAAEGILAHWEIPPAVMQSVLRATACARIASGKAL